MLNIGIYGASGRMGVEIKQQLKANLKAKASAFCDANDDIASFFDSCELVIDFSTKEGTKRLLNHAATHPKALVIGTTGLDDEMLDELSKLAKNMPILYATNMSLGIAVLKKLSYLASKTLKDFDIEIVEMHHRHKVDAPSGTALTLANTVAKPRELKSRQITGRQGLIGPRKKDEIGLMSLRGGDIAGKHTVGFYEDGEYLELIHTASSRATFAKGAIKAAIWLASQPAGLYDIDDSLGL